MLAQHLALFIGQKLRRVFGIQAFEVVDGVTFAQALNDPRYGIVNGGMVSDVGGKVPEH